MRVTHKTLAHILSLSLLPSYPVTKFPRFVSFAFNQNSVYLSAIYLPEHPSRHNEISLYGPYLIFGRMLALKKSKNCESRSYDEARVQRTNNGRRERETSKRGENRWMGGNSLLGPVVSLNWLPLDPVVSTGPVKVALRIYSLYAFVSLGRRLDNKFSRINNPQSTINNANSAFWIVTNATNRQYKHPSLKAPL